MRASPPNSPKSPLLFTAFALACLSLGAPAASAQTILRFDPPDLTLDAFNHPRAYLDFHTGALSYTTPSHYDLQFYFVGNDPSSIQTIGWFDPNTTYYQGFTAVIANNNAYADYFSAGTIFGGNHQFVYTAPINNGGFNTRWAAGTDGYLGAMTTTDLVNFNYAWVHVSYNADRTFTIRDFAFDTVANQSLAIAVPEPPAWTLLALGLIFAAFGSRLRLVRP